MPRYDLAGNPLPDDTPPRTDLAGNPLPQNGPPPGYDQQPYGGTPPASGYGGTPGNGYPGGAPGRGYEREPQQNTSGLKTSVPPEIASLKWNWGAFLCPFFWAWSNGQPLYCILIAALVLFSILTQREYQTLTDIAGIVLYVVMGATGHKLSWKSRHYPGGVSQYFEVQNAWMKWGFALFILIYGGVFLIYRIMPMLSGK